MANKNKFSFDDFYIDDEDIEDESNDGVDDEGVFADEEAYDKLLDLHEDKSSIPQKAQYPYIRVSGMIYSSDIVFKKETQMLASKVEKLYGEIKDKVNENELLNVVVSVLSNEYVIGRLPLTLDTILSLISGHRYDIAIIKDKDSEIEITNKLMKGLLFT